MKITMLGTSGSGKTVFSAALYSLFMSRDHQGFSLFSDGRDLPDQLLEVNKFRRDYDIIGQKRWPDRILETTNYPLDVYFRGRKIANFDWLDYRGGYIDHPDLGPDKAREIEKQIIESNAVLLFVNSEKLYKGSVREATYTTGADALLQVLSGVAKNYPRTYLTIVVLLTQCDLVPAEWSANNYRKLIKRACEVFAPLRQIMNEQNGIAETDQLAVIPAQPTNTAVTQRTGTRTPAEQNRAARYWTGGIIPISAIGLGQVKKNPDGEYQIVGFMEPFQVSEAVGYCIGQLIRQEYQLVSAEVGRQQRARNQPLENLITNWLSDQVNNLTNALRGQNTPPSMGYRDLQRYQRELHQYVFRAEMLENDSAKLMTPFGECDRIPQPPEPQDRSDHFVQSEDTLPGQDGPTPIEH